MLLGCGELLPLRMYLNGIHGGLDVDWDKNETGQRPSLG